jgi:hypothetical protein
VFYFLIGIRRFSVGRIPPDGFLNRRCGCGLHWVEWVLFYLSGFLCSHQFEKKKIVARFHSSELVNGDRTDACGTRAYVAFLGSLRTPSFGFLIKSC